MDEFYKKVADILEVDGVTGDSVLAGYPEWDSLSVLSVIAMIDSSYGINLNSTDLAGVKTAGELWQLVQARKGKQPL